MRSDYESLVDFAKEIERIEEVKNDYVVSADCLRMVNDESLEIENTGVFEVNDFCHGQIADRMGIPRKYYDATAQIPGLRTLNVNAWIREKENKRFVRTLDGKARAFLSDIYKPMDNYDILNNAIFPALQHVKNELVVKSMSISETKMYLQLIFPNLQGEIKAGDIVNFGITLSNSEVGAGSLNAESWFNRKVCDNGMVRRSLFKKYHVSRSNKEEEEASHLFEKDTVQKEIEAYQMKLRDVIKHMLKPETFEKELRALTDAAEDKVESITHTVENVTKRFGLSDKEGERIIQNMVDMNEITRWGIANGITAMAHDIENPDRQYHYEKLGSKIIDLSPSEWKIINKKEDE